jgi:putative tryptophan/tyrosine transport system substrate-binding protein
MAYPEGDQEGQAFLAAFREEFEKLGWMEGRNIWIDTRWAPAADGELRLKFAKELVALHPELVLSHGTPSTATLLQQTRTLPILFVNVTDPIGSGFLTSFAEPGGNVTGFINMEPTIAGKWLQLLKEIAPRVTRCAILFQSNDSAIRRIFLSPVQGRCCILRGRGNHFKGPRCRGP